LPKSKALHHRTPLYANGQKRPRSASVFWTKKNVDLLNLTSYQKKGTIWRHYTRRCGTWGFNSPYRFTSPKALSQWTMIEKKKQTKNSKKWAKAM
jgi:hypothetical protein